MAEKKTPAQAAIDKFAAAVENERLRASLRELLEEAPFTCPQRPQLRRPRAGATDMTTTPHCPDSDASFDLCEHEVGIVMGLVRDALRKQERNRHNGRRKWGDSFDDTKIAERVQLLIGIYEELGGDARRIENLRLVELEQDRLTCATTSARLG